MAVINDPNTATSIAKVDANGNQYTAGLPAGIEAHPAAGGFYTVAGGTTAIIAASLAANTTLMSARFSAASTRKAYVFKIRLNGVVYTAGAAGGIGTLLGVQRFTTATPTLGTARTPNEMNEPLTTATDMTDVRDLNSALTVTSVVFGNIVAAVQMPNSSTNVAPLEYVLEPYYPIVLAAGDGLCLRTMNAGPLTATWGFSYTLYWTEKPAVV
jgi:hypothetical protein